MNNNNSVATHGIKIKDKIGYALGDSAGVLTFTEIPGLSENSI